MYFKFYREEYLNTSDVRLRDELTMLDRRISELGGLTALGLFTVDRSLLTTIIGTTVTYIIILHDIRE